MLIEIFSNRTKYFGIVSPESMYAIGHVRHATGRMPLTRVQSAVFPLQPPVLALIRQCGGTPVAAAKNDL